MSCQVIAYIRSYWKAHAFLKPELEMIVKFRLYQQVAPIELLLLL